MVLTRGFIEALAPDQSALTAAAGLLGSSKWPVRARAGDVIWGECQGSGANPYRVAADMADGGAKCTCPSRKFPCKHGLALMLMCAGNADDFTQATIPDWVTEWQGRRRGSGGQKPVSARAEPDPSPARSKVPPPADPRAEAKKRDATQTRARETNRAVLAATEELDTWIIDQLASLPAFLRELTARCRLIAARLVDGKAAALSSRVDEIPSRLLPLPAHDRPDAAIAELGKLVLLVRSWRHDPADPALRREVIATETRDDLLANPAAPRLAATWEVLGERVTTRRDGLVSVATWLLRVGDPDPRFAVLQDFFPASAGRRSGAFTAGDFFAAELVFYPDPSPQRAVIAARQPHASAPAWPSAPADPLASHADHRLVAPWALETPILLPPGRICVDATGQQWLQAGAAALPLDRNVPAAALGAELSQAAGLWNGTRLALIAAQSNWGRVSFDG